VLRAAVCWMCYFALMFLFDVGEECGVGEIPFATWTSKFAFCLFFGFDDLLMIGCTLFLAH
jgi:hypothetical protein